MGRPKRGVTKEQRFWRTVDYTGDCWEWQGFRTARGYGRTRWDGPQLLAHRVAYELCVGPIPSGLMVLHRCDNPPCVRPDHLFLGTRLDNVRDMVAKGRQRHRSQPGERNGTAKLTDEEAAIIRRLRPRGKAAAAMASELGVHTATIHRVIRGATYRGAA